MLSTAPLLQTNLDGLTLHRRGKVRDVYEIGDAAADRRHRSHLGVRLRARLRHPRQGEGAHAAVRLLVRAHGRSRAASPDLDGRRRVPGRGAPPRGSAAGPDDAGAPDRAGPDRMRGARLPVGLGLEGIPADRQRLRRPAADRACANPIACPSRSSRRPRRPRPATTSTSARRKPAGSSAPIWSRG